MTVVNDDNRSLGPVVVELEGHKVFDGMLTPGQRRTVRIEPTRDASFRVYGHGPSGSFDVSGLGYSTPNDGQDHVFHLRGNVVRYGDAPQQFVELRTPEGDGPFPVIVFIHGGGWHEGEDPDQNDGPSSHWGSITGQFRGSSIAIDRRSENPRSMTR